LLVAAARGLRPDLEAMAAAQSCRRAEAAAGARVGLMDHAASALAREGHALLLDCATLERRHVRLPPGLALAVLDTGVTRRLAETPYAERRRAAEAAVAALGGSLGPGPDAERDPVLRHLVSEVGRVRRFVAAAEREDLEEMGRLVDESHASLRDDLRVSLPQVDSLVARARAVPGCLGARIMGAGFGGSVLALLREGAQDRFASALGAPVRACRTTSGAFAA
ncbi:MAG: galactokinase, partial [Candidatus Dormibacterales bacterium]